MLCKNCDLQQFVWPVPLFLILIFGLHLLFYFTFVKVQSKIVKTSQEKNNL